MIVTTFASSIHRVSMILELALKNGRKVGLLGRSMLNVIAKARELGYMRAPDELFVPIKQINDVPDRETLLLMTGSQGEPLAACLLYTSPSPRDLSTSRMPSSA